MTTTEAREIIHQSNRCTNAVCRAFHLPEHSCPSYGSGLLAFMRSANYECTEDETLQGCRMANLERYLDKDVDYIIFTKNHAMAYVDGILIDTAGQEWDSRRVEHIFTVE